MNVLTAQQLRDRFLKFFEQHGHTIIPSAPLVPQNDPSVLFTTAGMHPLVPFLLGQDHPGGTRVADVQKCVRTTDIDDVGDNRHLTFFEMLGNWSFGDYFKNEAIQWSFEFLTGSEWLGIDPVAFYVSVFAGDADVPRDEQAIEAWKKAFASHPAKPIEAHFSTDIYAVGGSNKIFAYGRDKNWWQAGDKGPAGPDTEMFVDTEAHLGDSDRQKHKHWQQAAASQEQCHINCDCGRFVEIWNNVFMQYNGLGGSKYEPLKQNNVDTGMGLERVLTFVHGQNSVYDTELFRGAFEIIVKEIGEMTNEQEIKARIIVDHLRAAVFMVSDGVVPSNKERGYILRRILRRAIVHGKLLGMKGDWAEAIVKDYIAQYKTAYPELEANRRTILNTILEEQKKFENTLSDGMNELKRRIAKGQESSASISAKDAFDLYQSFGIPWEVTVEILASSTGAKLNRQEFEDEFKKHQELSRTASAGTFKGGLAGHSPTEIRYHTATHLLQAALRKVLGEHVAQKGSNINTERMRFDFTHPQKMTPEEIAETERLVNEMIAKDLAVRKDIMTSDEARKLGAIGLFGEKYGDTVSVYTVLDGSGAVYSREFCGGPHVEHTAEIGTFKITKEEAVSAGVRRIKAVIS